VLCDDDRSDDAAAGVRHDIVAVDLAPLITGTRLLKMIGAVVDGLAAVPVVVIHMVATLPILVLDVLLLGVIVLTVDLLRVMMVVLLGYKRERRATDAEEDACGESFLEQSY